MKEGDFEVLSNSGADIMSGKSPCYGRSKICLDIITRAKSYLKQWHDGRPPCYDHCPKASGCKKFIAHRKILEEIEETIQNKDVKEARKKFRTLYIKMLRTRGHIIRCIHTKKKLAKIRDVFASLFHVKSFDFLPLNNNYIMKKVRKRLEHVLNVLYQERFLKEFIVRTTHRRFNYLRRFTRNLFDCFVSCNNYVKGNFNFENDIPNVLYHGTTTKFLPEIMEKGLLPSKAGRCWKEYRNQKPEGIYLTDSMYAAEAYALKARKEFGGEPIVFEVNIKSMKKKLKIGIDIFNTNGKNSTIFDIHKEMFFAEPIPPNRIKNWYLPPKIPAVAMLELLRSSAQKG